MSTLCLPPRSSIHIAFTRPQFAQPHCTSEPIETPYACSTMTTPWRRVFDHRRSVCLVYSSSRSLAARRPQPRQATVLSIGCDMPPAKSASGRPGNNPTGRSDCFRRHQGLAARPGRNRLLLALDSCRSGGRMVHQFPAPENLSRRLCNRR